MRKMTRTLILSLLVATLAAGLTPAVTGASLAGYSGQCYNRNGGAGGGASVGVNDDATVDGADQAELTSYSNAARYYVSASVSDFLADLSFDIAPCTRYDCGPTAPRACTGTQTERKDYQEVHAAGVQVCRDAGLYEGLLAGIRIDGGCPTTPPGPGA